MTYAILHLLSFYLVLKSVVTADCPEIYRRYSEDHSYCKPKNTSCNIVRTSLTQKEIAQVLELHNSFRSTIATQLEKNANLPPAANMLQMEWDNELAAVAQQYATQCIYAHDQPNQRRVRNFGVGQNIAKQTLTGQNIQPPNPDWAYAVTAWYEEVVYFSEDLICPFKAPDSGKGEYRHFSQLIWSGTFRVGCGYTLYKEGNTYVRLYICNYGPAGNVYGTCVYKSGEPCRFCPENTCCSDECLLDEPSYPGLCKRYNDEAPIALSQQPTIFDCNFQDADKEDCLISIEGPQSWYIIPALEGNYLEAVLKAGQNSTITFSKLLRPNSSTFCVRIKYRKGPTIHGKLADNKATETFVLPSMNGYTLTQSLTTFSGPFELQFSSFDLTLQWDKETQMKISFAAGANADPQYFDIDSIVAMDQACGK